MQEGEAIALRRGALHAVDDGAGQLDAPGRAPGQQRRKVGCPADAQPLQAALVGRQRVRREVETDGGKLILQPLHRRPVRHLGQLRTALGGVVAEQVVLVAAARLVRRLRMPRQRLHGGKGLRPVLVQRVEGACLHEALQQPLVQHALVEPFGEVEQVLEGAVGLSLLGEARHRLLADALDGRQRIPDRLLAVRGLLDGELGRGLVHVGRQQLDIDLVEVAAIAVELFHVAHVEGHRGGEELDRMVGLEIGGLVADQRVSCGVGLVEAVTRELVDLIEDRRGLVRLHVVLLGALDEERPLGVHLRLDLLAHGATQQVSAAQRVAAQHLRDLHDLLLVDHDAVGFLQDPFQQRMQVIRLLLAMLALDVARDVLHRAGAVERHHGNDVLEAVGLHLAQHIAHAVAFELEHPRSVAPGEQLEGLSVVERQFRDIDAVLADEVASLLDHRQSLQAEEVELHQARRLDPFHIELGCRERFLAVGIPEQRHQLVERPVSDHHAGSMGRGVAEQPLELQREIDQSLDLLVRVVLFLQQLLGLQRLRQRHRIGRVVRHQLADPVDLPVRHAQHAADVAQHRAGLQLAEGDDRGDPVVAVLVAHVADDAVALVLAEVDVEVGHRHAFGVEEALEQQAPAQRVEVGDLERPGDQRARTRTAAGTDRHVVVLGPLDEVGHDKEVAREPHLLDHVELVGQPGFILVDADPVGQAPELLQLIETGLGQVAQRLAFGAALELRIARQDRLARRGHVGAALGYHQGVVAGLGNVGEQGAHLGGRLEIVFGRQATPVGIVDMRALLDAEQHVVRLVHRFLREVRVVGCDQRQVALVGEIDERRLDAALGVLAVTLQFQVEPAVEQPLQPVEHVRRRRRLARRQQPPDGAARATGQRDQPRGRAFQLRHRQSGDRSHLEFEMGPAHQPHQVDVALLALDQQGQPIDSRQLVRRGNAALLLAPDAEIAADDRLYAGLRGVLREFQRAEEVVAIGDGNRRHRLALGERDDLVDLVRPLGERVGGTNLQMDEISDGHGPSSRRGLWTVRHPARHP